MNTTNDTKITMPSELTSREKAKLKKLIVSWGKSVIKQIPQGMVINGIVSGGKGMSHGKLIYGGLTLSFIAAMLLGNLLQLLGLPLIMIFFIILVVLNLSVQLMGEVGIYRSVILVWDTNRLVVLERAAFDRLKNRTVYERPLKVPVSWESHESIRINDKLIHLDHPRLCRHLLQDALFAGTADRQTGSPGYQDSAQAVQQKGKLYVFANILIALGFLGWGSAFLLSVEACGTLPFLEKVELPMGPAQIIVDNEERFYLIPRFYRRVQLYDHDGVFVKGWHLATHKGEHVCLIDQNNDLHINVENITSWTHYILDQELGVMESSKPGKKWKIPRMPHRQSVSTVEYRSWYFFPHVVKRDRSGNETTIFRAPLWQWPLTAPFPAFALVIIGIIAIPIITTNRRDAPPCNRGALL